MHKIFKYSLQLIFLYSLLSCVHDPVTDPPEVASSLKYSPDSLAIEIGISANSEKPTISGTSPFTYSIQSNPSADGNISISSEGIIQVSENITEGNYSIDVIVLNEVGTVEFPEAFSIRAFSNPDPPTQLTYSPSSTSILSGQAFTSVTPTIQGTAPFTFSISDNPEPGIISIDDQGVITSSAALEVGSYPLNIEVENEAKSEIFNAAFTINVSSSATAPANLTYTDDTLTLIVGNAGSSAIPNLNGTAPFSFSLTSNPDASGNLTIDNSGIISASSSLAIGTYDISVTVGNAVDTVSFANIFTVTVNPVPPVTFLNDVRPLILSKCSSCHTGGSQPNFTVYANASSSINTILDRVQRTPGSTGFMPSNRAALPASEIQILQDWLADGLLQ